MWRGDSWMRRVSAEILSEVVPDLRTVEIKFLSEADLYLTIMKRKYWFDFSRVDIINAKKRYNATYFYRTF